jgi:uncharacterized protein YndB with AHSA1/START domain
MGVMRNGEIHSERVFPVPRETLFAAFMDAAMLTEWWGPHGSENSFEVFDPRPGGLWEFVMRAADGASYRMTNRFVEIVPPERIVLRHDQDGHGFDLVMNYDIVDDASTTLHWCMRFDSPEEAERVRPFVVEANEQNFDRLERVLRVRPTRVPQVSG